MEETPAQQPMRYASQRFQHIDPADQSADVDNFAVRLFRGRIQEHREAADFVRQRKKFHGEGVQTFVRGVLLFRDYLESVERHGEPYDPATLMDMMIELAARRGEAQFRDDLEKMLYDSPAPLNTRPAPRRRG